MNVFQAVVLSLVEGITEFLPISSTGHLILASKLLNIPQTEFVKSFEIIIQFGAILAVVVLYFKTLIKKTEIIKRVLIAFFPTAVLGLIFYSFIKHYLIGNLFVVIASLFFGGILMLLFEKVFKTKKGIKNIGNLSYKKSFVTGVIQSISMIPGVSRAAATIYGGLGVGLNRKSAVEFSFLLAVPTMFAATVLDLLKVGFTFSRGEYLILSIGFVGAFISAMITIKYLINYVKKHSFRIFAVYRIVLAAIFWFIFK